MAKIKWLPGIKADAALTVSNIKKSLSSIEMESFKQRHKRAVDRAIFLLESPPANYKAYEIKDIVFDVIAIRPSEIVNIRIVLDEISSDDIRVIRESELPDNMIKKVMCKEKDKRGFIEKIIS